MPIVLIISWLIVALFCPCQARAQPAVFDAGGYGSRPEGVTVSTAAIQKAIDTAAVAGGGVVTLPRGTTMVWTTAWLTL